MIPRTKLKVFIRNLFAALFLFCHVLFQKEISAAPTDSIFDCLLEQNNEVSLVYNSLGLHWRVSRIKTLPIGPWTTDDHSFITGERLLTVLGKGYPMCQGLKSTTPFSDSEKWELLQLLSQSMASWEWRALLPVQVIRERALTFTREGNGEISLRFYARFERALLLGGKPIRCLEKMTGASVYAVAIQLLQKEKEAWRESQKNADFREGFESLSDL